MNKYLVNRLCKQKEFFTKDYNDFCKMIKEAPRYHRKQLEFFWIYQALKELGMLQKGKKGLALACGEEPLPALFASMGCQVLATDLGEEDERAKAWQKTGQHGTLEKLNQRGICSQDDFKRLVSFRPVDMNNMPNDLGKFDFVYSSCALEHLSSIEKGMIHFAKTLELLNPGGVTVHTTEMNVSHEKMTLDYDPVTVIFRKSDIEMMRQEAEEKGYIVGDIDWDTGDGELDKKVDHVPYSSDEHLKLDIEGFTATSFIIIIRKPE